MRYDIVERRCAEMGATSDEERGRLLGVNRNTVLRWRKGHNGVNLTTAMRVASVLGVRLDQLVDTTGGQTDA